MSKQLFKHYLSRQAIYTPKTYNHEVTLNHASADGNFQKITKKASVYLFMGLHD